MADFEQFGRFIRASRTENDIGVRELARRVDITGGAMSQLEQGKYRPSIELIKRLADALELNADELIVAVGLVPDDVYPESLLEVRLFRAVKAAPPEVQRETLDELTQTRNGDNDNE